MLMLLVAHALMSAGVQSTAATTTGGFDFQGTALGASIEDLTSQHHDAACHAKSLTRTECHRGSVKLGIWDAAVDYYYFGEAIGYQRLYAIKVYFFSSGAVKEVADGLEGRWGPPSDTNGDGLWKKSHAHILLRFDGRGGSIEYVDEITDHKVSELDRSAASQHF